MGLLGMMIGSTAKAMSRELRAIELNNTGMELYYAGNYSEALRYFSQALVLMPLNETYRNNKQMCLDAMRY